MQSTQGGQIRPINIYFPIQILKLSRHLVRAEQSHIRPIKNFGTTNKSWFNVSIVGILSLPVLMYERTNFEYGILKRKLQTCHTNYRNHGCNSQFKRSMSQISSIKLRRSNILYSWHKADMQNIELCSQKGKINHRNISLSTGILALHNFPRIIADIRHKPIINRLNCFLEHNQT